MKDIMKIVKSLEDSGLSLKGVSEAKQNDVKEEKEELLSFLLGTLGASLFGNMLKDKWFIRARYGSKKGKEGVRAGCGSTKSLIKDF